MKRLKALFLLACSVLTTLALTIGVATAGAQCVMFFHQPKVPHGMSKFKAN